MADLIVDAASIGCAEVVVTNTLPNGMGDSQRIKLKKMSDAQLLVSQETDTEAIGETETNEAESKTTQISLPAKRKLTRKKPKQVKLFQRGQILAVRSDEDDFWLCQTKENVYDTSNKFNIQWLNNASNGVENEYELGLLDTTELECVISSAVTERKIVYTIHESEKQRILGLLKDVVVDKENETSKPKSQ